MQTINKILIGDSFTTIDSKAFNHLPSLKVLDLSASGIYDISSEAFYDLPNLIEIDLNDNQLDKLEDNTFYDLPNLVKLELSRNFYLHHIGNMFDDLKNPDLVVDLVDNSFKVLLKESFKPFLDTVIENNGNGYIDLTNSKLQCECDVNWYLTSYLEYPDVLRNLSCLSPMYYNTGKVS